MGRNDLLTEEEVSAELGVGPRWMKQLAKSGSLVPVPGYKENLYRKEDLAGLLEARLKQHDLASVTLAALQGRELSRSIATRLDELGKLLGLDVAVLPVDEDSVMSHYLGVKEALEHKDFSLEEVLHFANELRSVDENYLRMVQEYTADPEPWRSFYELGLKLTELVEKAGPDDEKAVAIGRARHAANTIRQVAYFYTRDHEGKRQAEDLFPEGDVDEQVLMHLRAISPGR
jgi:hypothetical protein